MTSVQGRLGVGGTRREDTPPVASRLTRQISFQLLSWGWESAASHVYFLLMKRPDQELETRGGKVHMWRWTEPGGGGGACMDPRK